MIASLLFALQVLATVYMTGVIWFVQLVHYPLMAHVPRNQFTDFEREHTRRTGWVVGPPIVLEIATTVAMFFALPSGVPLWAAYLGGGLLLLVDGITFGWFVAAHAQLSRGFDEELHQRLVRYNWVRTVGWTARSVLLLSLVLSLLIR